MKMYSIVEHTDKDSFIKLVQQNLDMKWELHGSVSVVTEYDSSGKPVGIRYIQAIVANVEPFTHMEVQ